MLSKRCSEYAFLIYCTKLANLSILVESSLCIIMNSSIEILSLSRILINLIHEISDSPRSNLDICDLERFSSEIEQILTCLF